MASAGYGLPGIVGTYGSEYSKTARKKYFQYEQYRNAGYDHDARRLAAACLQACNELLTSPILQEIPPFHPWKARAVVYLIHFEGSYAPRVNDMVQKIVQDVDVRRNDPTVEMWECNMDHRDLYMVRDMVMNAVNDDPDPFRMAQ